MQAKGRSAGFGKCPDGDNFILTVTLNTSVNILERTRSEDDAAKPCYSYNGMYRSLCVLKMQQVLMDILRHLWNMNAYEKVIFVVDMLSEVGLVDVHFRKVCANEMMGGPAA